jgi:hypothetical protein
MSDQFDDDVLDEVAFVAAATLLDLDENFFDLSMVGDDVVDDVLLVCGGHGPSSLRGCELPRIEVVKRSTGSR